jgi:hypothetical protein
MSGFKLSIRAFGLAELLAALLAAVCLSACASSISNLDSARIERAIARSILTEHHLDATVSCPAKIRQLRGDVFTCTALFEVGTYPVTVTETGNGGEVRYRDERPLVALNIAKVQGAIEASVARERHVRAKVSCPGEVLQQVGLHFRCIAVFAGGARRAEFDVQELDSTGHVRYVGI